MFVVGVLSLVVWLGTFGTSTGQFETLSQLTAVQQQWLSKVSQSNSESCQGLLESYRDRSCPYVDRGDGSSSGPPKTMPVDLVAAYTLNGSVPTAEFFVDDSNSSQVGLVMLGVVVNIFCTS